MKAIHNRYASRGLEPPAVNYTQRYKKWKQFTTKSRSDCFWAMLWTIHKDTKNESNSQRVGYVFLHLGAVNYTQRYKKWKQFTTLRLKARWDKQLWTIHKDTKNESNSQRYRICHAQQPSCELYTKIQKMKAIHNASAAQCAGVRAVNYTQRYKKWKQFTTMMPQSYPYC